MDTKRSRTGDIFKLMPSGGEAIVLSRKAADLCITLRNVAEDTSDGQAFPIPYEGKVVAMAARALEACTEGGTVEMELGEAAQIAEVAHFLEAEKLTDMVCTRLADLITQMGSAEAVCERFQVECELSPEERKALVTTEAPWEPPPSTKAPPPKPAPIRRREGPSI